jgi:site-specific recombinase XerD
MRIIQTKGIVQGGILDIVIPKDLSNGEVDVIVVSKDAPDEFESRHQAMIQQGYDTPAKVIDLIQQIKLDMLKEKGRT